MHHSLRKANSETHVRIVGISLAAGIAVVIGALNMKFDQRGEGHQAWASAAVIKASQQGVYFTSARSQVR